MLRTPFLIWIAIMAAGYAHQSFRCRRLHNAERSNVDIPNAFIGKAEKPTVEEVTSEPAATLRRSSKREGLYCDMRARSDVAASLL
jgi:hypothetical protein